MFWKKKSPYTKQLAEILAQLGNRESLLGVQKPIIPTPDDIRKDAAKLYRYSQSSDYKQFADEAWSRVIGHLDKILDERSSQETRVHNCGAMKATLDLLRLSYQARELMDQLDSEKPTSSRS